MASLPVTAGFSANLINVSTILEILSLYLSMARRRRKKTFKKTKLGFSLKLKKDTVGSVIFIFLLALTVLMIFSFLDQGSVPIYTHKLLKNYFGLGAIMVPFLTLLLAFNFYKAPTPFKQPTIVLGFFIMFVSFLSIFSQGSAGKFLWDRMEFLFTKIPAFFIFFFFFLIGFIVFFDTSISQVIKEINKLFLLVKRYTIGNASKTRKKDKFGSPVYVQEDNKPNQSPPPQRTADKPMFADTALSNKPITSSMNQNWQYPPDTILDRSVGAKADRGDVRKNAQIIEDTLESFGITARVAEVNNSPSVTQYALEVALGTKLSKIQNLSNDLAMALAAPGGQIRVEAPIPGRSLVGIEVPNRSLEVVNISQVLDSPDMKKAKSKTVVPLGLGVSGQPAIADIQKMPHVLIAGQTGSGKSVCLNSWIFTLLFRASPDELRLIMVDPKRVELTPFNGIPHLLVPVIVEPDKVVSALKWAVSEMERRYKLFSEVGAKNIETYNNMAAFQTLPFIVIVIDELADIMLFSPGEVEESICRIAQMARAVGIHLVVATQRPSVDVITGLIKANIPARMAFAVSSSTDSRVILDSVGAEKLLGRGDMLYIPPELAKPVRIQGCYVSDSEIEKLITFLKSQKTAEYDDQVTSQPVSGGSSSTNLVSVEGEERDVMFQEAVNLVRQENKASASLLQRRLKLGYARAARVLDQLERANIIGPSNGAKPRDILPPSSSV